MDVYCLKRVNIDGRTQMLLYVITFEFQMSV